MRKNFERCDVSKIGRKKGCQQIGTYDGDSIMHYHPVFTIQVIENGKYVDKEFRMFTMKDRAHALCEGRRCRRGQRNGLSPGDISDIATLYSTSCIKGTYQRNLQLVKWRKIVL